MAMPARVLELENPLEERVARPETKVEHIQSDISDIKFDVRKMNDKIEAVDQKLTSRIDTVKDSMTALTLKMEQSFAAVDKTLGEMRVSTERSFGKLHVARAFDHVWWLLMSGALLAVMARAFKWI